MVEPVNQHPCAQHTRIVPNHRVEASSVGHLVLPHPAVTAMACGQQNANDEERAIATERNSSSWVVL
jgi:hypothetical protein